MPTPPHTTPVFAKPEPGAWFDARVAEFEQQMPGLAPGGVVFVGDSITQGYALDFFFPGRPVINRGIGGDRVEDVLRRLDISVTRLQPSKVFLMIGTNDAMFPLYETDVWAHNAEILLWSMRQSAPDARIYVQSILPARGGWAANNGRVHEYNTILRRLAPRYGARYIDLHRRFADANGELRAELTDDGLHLNIKGYEIWSDTIRRRVD